MKNYYRFMLGKKNVYAEECLRDGFIGIECAWCQDLTGKVPEDWRQFNLGFIPLFLEQFPGKSRIAAGLAGGVMWNIAKGVKQGDIVLCPVGNGIYRVGEVTGEYYYRPGRSLQHCRPVKWYPQTIERIAMSEMLRNSTGSVGTIVMITRYQQELDLLIGGQKPPQLIATDEDVEDPALFAMEKHLEDFLVANWNQTELGREYDIYAEDGELVGQQYPSDTGPIDILAVSKDKKTLLVVELKKGRASDVVVGQIQRYMGYVKEELAEPGQSVKGIIIALEKDNRLQRALSVTANIDFYHYQVSFKLVRG